MMQQITEELVTRVAKAVALSRVLEDLNGTIPIEVAEAFKMTIEEIWVSTDPKDMACVERFRKDAMVALKAIGYVESSIVLL